LLCPFEVCPFEVQVLSPYPQTSGPINEFGLCWETFVLFDKARRTDGDLLDRAGAVYHPRAVRIGPGQIGESSLHSRKELDPFAFQAILATRARRCRGLVGFSEG
jgi:hypothetical protein